jgi:hypothetical protein
VQAGIIARDGPAGFLTALKPREPEILHGAGGTRLGLADTLTGGIAEEIAAGVALKSRRLIQKQPEATDVGMLKADTTEHQQPVLEQPRLGLQIER